MSGVIGLSTCCLRLSVTEPGACCRAIFSMNTGYSNSCSSTFSIEPSHQPFYILSIKRFSIYYLYVCKVHMACMWTP